MFFLIFSFPVTHTTLVLQIRINCAPDSKEEEKMHNLCRSKNKEHIRCGFRKKYK